MSSSAQAEPERIEETHGSAHSSLIGLKARASRKPVTWEVIKSLICRLKSASAADFHSLGAKSGALIGTTSNTAQSVVAAQEARAN